LTQESVAVGLLYLRNDESDMKIGRVKTQMTEYSVEL